MNSNDVHRKASIICTHCTVIPLRMPEYEQSGYIVTTVVTYRFDEEC